jgi:lipopolysaccharide transport system permease protein
LNKDKIIIDSNLSSFFSLKDVLKYRGLLNNLAKRDFLVRYKQASIGIVWALIKPLISILIFGYIASKISSGESSADSFLNVAAGMLLWQLFASVFAEVSGSIVNNSNLFSKVYFPKIIIPISTIMVCLVDFFISLIILIVLFFIADQTIHWQVIFAPFFILLTVINGFGIGLFFATLYVKYRDMRFIVSIILQFGMYASPVIFASSFYLSRLESVSVAFKWLYCLNPMVGAIDGFRYCLFGTNAFDNPYLFVLSVCVSFIFLFLGIKFFYKFERNFVDFI